MFRKPIILAVCLALLHGCGSESPKRHAGTPGDPWIIGMSQCNLGEPWRVQMDADVRAAAEGHDNLRVIFKDAQNESLTQRAQVEEFVEQGVDLIIISPKEAAPLTRPVAEAYQRGIPVIVLDRAVQGDQYTTFIGADNVRIGREAGKWIRERLGGTRQDRRTEGPDDVCARTRPKPGIPAGTGTGATPRSGDCVHR